MVLSGFCRRSSDISNSTRGDGASELEGDGGKCEIRDKLIYIIEYMADDYGYISHDNFSLRMTLLGRRQKNNSPSSCTYIKSLINNDSLSSSL